MTACFRIPGQSPVPDHCEAREVEKGFWCKPGRQLLWGRLKEGNGLPGENACMRSYEDELTIPTRTGDDQRVKGLVCFNIGKHLATAIIQINHGKIMESTTLIHR